MEWILKTPDTEVILESYKFGIKIVLIFLKECFAFAIWDKN